LLSSSILWPLAHAKRSLFLGESSKRFAVEFFSKHCEKNLRAIARDRAPPASNRLLNALQIKVSAFVPEPSRAAP
jgi:hypothetical protein